MAMDTYLIVNVGSSSKRYALFHGDKQIFMAHFAQEHNQPVVTIQTKQTVSRTHIQYGEYVNSLEYLLTIYALKRITAIGCRVVVPDYFFAKTRLINRTSYERLKAAQTWASTHITAVLEELGKLQRFFPKVPLIAVSDSTFHNTIPTKAKLYALPLEVSKKFGVYRLGYHGISIQSVLRMLSHTNIRLSKRVIVCHLGGGSSVTAIKNGKSVDTSMGFTPLEGVPMSTRIGSIDPGALLYLGQKSRLEYTDLMQFLSTRCGLSGISDTTGDMKTLLALEQKGDRKAKQAVSLYVYAIQKYIGAYYTVLGGLDQLIFTGGIGAGSPEIRERICTDLKALGIVLDSERNKSQRLCIEAEASKVTVTCIEADEMHEIALQVRNFLKAH